MLAHELVGHGARYRELGIGSIDYGFEWPPPYGAGGGFASAELGSGFTEQEVMAIWTAGLETHGLLQRRLGLRWMARDELRLRRRPAALVVVPDPARLRHRLGRLRLRAERQRPRAYVRLLNTTAGQPDVADFVWTLDDLKRVYRRNIANPFPFLAVFAQLERLWNGGHARPVPSIRIGDVALLPALRTGLTPLGGETHLET